MTLAYYGKSRRRQSWLLLGAVLALIAGMVLAVSAGQRAFADHDGAHLHPDHVGATAPGFQTEGDCGPFEGDFDWAFHFVFQGSSTDFVTIDATFTGGGQVHEVVDGKHAWVYVNSDNGAVTLTGASATTVHNGGNQELDTTFNLSHICAGEGDAEQFNVVVTKFVDGNLATEGTFDLTATWDAANRMDTGGPFQLTADETYSESSPLFDAGYDYSIVENGIDGDCDDEGDVYRLLGYSVNGGIIGPTASIVDGQANGTIVVHNETCDQPEGPFNVTVNKWIDGALATEGSFDLTATWTAANLNGGVETSGDFMLNSGNGWTAVTSDMDTGYDYTAVENDIDDICEGEDVYRLVGYSLDGGAVQATPIEIVGGIADHTITVHNALCDVDEGPFNVTVNKWIDGALATEGSFDLTATWTAANLNGGVETSGDFMLNSGNGWTAVTSDMDTGYDYTAVENDIDDTCDLGDEYMLVGYSLDGGAVQAEPIEIVGGTADHTITVHNALCPITSGTSTVILEKEAGGLAGSTATFSTTGLLDQGFDAILEDDGAFTLDDDAATVGVGNTISFVGLEGGAGNDFTITEDEITGWSLTGLSCSEETAADLTGQVVVDDVAGSLSFDLDASAGLVVTCVFTNTQNPVAGTSDVTIVKDAGDLPNSTTSFTVVGLPGSADFDLDDDSLTGSVDDSMFFPGLSDVSFTITEGEAAGWSLEDIVCTEAGSADLEGVATISLGDRNVSFDIGADAGLSITCTFTNQQASTGETPTATPTDETPTATPTDETPTATPTDETPTETSTTGGATPVTSTAEGVIEESAVAGATPIAPSTGTGTSAAERSATLGLVIAGLVAMTAGTTLFAIRRRA
ncbi:MAG: hypothetical protein WD557_17460 [Dehalococcoidia bacterium]